MQAGQAQTLIICTGTHKETGQPCHAELDSEAEYCGKCGTPVPKPRVCSGKRKNGSPCQFKLPEDYECCPQCGTEVPSTEEEVPRRDYCTGTNKDGTPCKAELNHGQALCGKCGTPQNVSTDAVAEPESRSQAAQKAAKLNPTVILGGSRSEADDKKVGKTQEMVSQRDVPDEGEKGATSAEAPKVYADVVKHGAQESPNSSVTERKQTEDEGNTTLGSVTGTVNVVFIVIISEQFRYQPGVDKAFVQLGPTFEETRRILLERVRDSPAGHIVQGTVPMSKEERNKGFDYKYIVHKYDTKRGETETVINRHFRVPAKDRHTSGDYNQYDGIVYPKQSWSEEFIKTYLTGKYKSDAQAAGEEYLPSAEEVSKSLLCPSIKPEKTAEDYLDDIQDIMSTMPCQITVGKVVDQDSQLISRCVENKLVKPLLETIRTHLADQEDAIRTTTLAMFLLLLTERFNVKMENMDNVNMLCRAMLVTPDMCTQTVPEIDHLKEHFPVKMQDKKKMAEHVQRLIHMSGDPAADCSWLCCVPLLHFLEDLSTPFRALTPSKNYKAEEWWGIASFEDRKKSFKTAWRKKSENDVGEILYMVAKLEPLFAADALFSRSVVACLNYESLLIVLVIFDIPIEVTGATLASNIHLRGRMRQSKETERMLLRVINKMSHLWKESGDSFSEEHLKLTRCQVYLVRKQFSEILKKGDYFCQELTLCMIRVMFGGLDRLAHEEDYVCKENSPLEWQHQAPRVCKRACEWHKWYSDPLNGQKQLSAIVQAWNKLLQQTEDLRHGQLKMSCEANISEYFKTALNEVQFKLPSMRLLQVYSPLPPPPFSY